MKEATLMHNDLVRQLLKEHKGYEVVKTEVNHSGEGMFLLLLLLNILIEI